MKISKFNNSMTALALFCMTACGEPQLGKSSVDKVIAAMTLEEKAAFVVGTERNKVTPPDAPPGVMPVRQQYSEEYQKLLDACTTDQERERVAVATSTSSTKVAGAAGQHYAIEHLGIEPITYADGPAGLRIDAKRKNDDNEYYCTAFPVGVTIASSWDTDLVYSIAQAIGNEVKEYGVDILLAPAINIHRSPLCGRNFEYYSEDPLLCGKIASAYVAGVQSNGVGVSVKHFAVNNQETCRNGIDVQLSERALREIYLKAFEIAVKESQPWTIMSSYNKVNGTLASENRYLLTDILRDEWGFKGFVMTDWWAEENGARQIAAGNDLLMPGSKHQYEEILSGIADGTLSMSALDKAVRNIMNVMLKTPTYQHYEYSNKPDLESHAALARKVAAEAMVLLKNDNKALPLRRDAVVSLFGTSSYDLLVGGSGSGNVNRKYKVSLDKGLQTHGVKLESSLAERYSEYIRKQKADMPEEYFWSVPVVSEMPLNSAMVRKAVGASDVVVYTLSRMAGEGGDRKLIKGDYYLSDTEKSNIAMVSNLAHKAGKKFILVLNMGNVVDISPIVDMPDAILQAWMGGQEMGNSLADVLVGQINPSGKLPFTWALNYKDYPSADNFPCSDGNPAVVRHEEDIFVGYRHFGSHNVKPLYPFGYGLSYTNFEYSQPVVTQGEDGKISASITVRNAGKVPGREVVQLYVSAPEADLEKPESELKAFAKTNVLDPGQSQVLAFDLTSDDFASYTNSGWKADNGEYDFRFSAAYGDTRASSKLNLKF